jgi:iron-sulfur cluster assembly accessory protein
VGRHAARFLRGIALEVAWHMAARVDQAEREKENSAMSDTSETTTTTLVSVTPSAAEKVRELLDQEGNEVLGLRIFVAGGGCSGLQYGMTLDESQDGDEVFETNGVRVLIDEMSAQYISGSEVDYVDSLMGAGFTVNNPNAVSTCGCGHSFKTATDSGQARGCGCGH